jgi:hypothetical protein
MSHLEGHFEGAKTFLGCWVFLCVVVCCCVLEGWGGLLVAMLCEQGRGLVGGRAPPPTIHSVGIHGCLLVGGGVL